MHTNRPCKRRTKPLIAITIAPIVQKKNNITNRQHTHYQPDRNHEAITIPTHIDHNTCASQAQPISSFPLSSDEQDTTDATNPLNATIELTIFIQSIPYHEINATHAHAPIVQKKNNITNRQHTHYQPDRNHE
eukprot:815124_1